MVAVWSPEMNRCRRRNASFRKEEIRYNTYRVETAILISGIRDFIERNCVYTEACDICRNLRYDSENTMCGPVNVDWDLTILTNPYKRVDLIYEEMKRTFPYETPSEWREMPRCKHERTKAEDEFHQLTMVRNVLGGCDLVTAFYGVEEAFRGYSIYHMLFKYATIRYDKPYLIEDRWREIINNAHSYSTWRLARKRREHNPNTILRTYMY